MRLTVAIPSLLVVVPCLLSCSSQDQDAGRRDGAAQSARGAAVVGAWLVKDSAAPFPYHMYVFNADGTMQQANPDAGDANTSDSDGKGIWVSEGERVTGKWVEITADRTSHRFVARGEISYELRVAGNAFTGNAVARFYGSDGDLVTGPIRTVLTGTRVTLP